MPIEKGAEWGQPGELPNEAPIVATDSDLARLIGHEPIAAVEAGDLARTLGVSGRAQREGFKQLLPIDALAIELDDGSTHMCVAHAVVGHVLRSTEFVAIMNAAFIGSLNLAPRAHPGDGKADVVTMRLGLGDRIKAWRRMPTGTHVPHPSISISRKGSGRVDLERPTAVLIDGRTTARTRSLRYTVVPEAITVAV